MSTIYEPKGAALEYSRLACNLYKGCEHGCTYCYMPTIPPWKFSPTPRKDFHGLSLPRKDILKQLERDAKKMRGDPREILFCFTCDPFQVGRDNSVTMEALKICEKHRLRCQILTKGGMDAANSFDTLARNGWKFGTTLLFSDDSDRLKFEPFTATVWDRIAAISLAHDCGIYTWLSIEPVIYPAQALEVMELTRDYVDFFKVGKLNHNPDLEAQVDWLAFRDDAETALKGKNYMIKDALKRYGDYGPGERAIETQDLAREWPDRKGGEG